MKKRRILPPVYLAASLLTMVALNFLAPILVIVRAPWNQLGWIPIGMGLATILWAALTFRRHHTTVIPFRIPSHLVTSGVFRLSRNPMYLAMMAILAGAAIGLGSLSPLVVPPIFFLIIRTRFVQVEEKVLLKNFGETYFNYRASVRRWL
ncbi:MAG: isoprenylcysteine carboxylmethyltransferase family protein [Planctomycetota bacterium]